MINQYKRLIFLFVYIGLICFSLALIIKPDASLFLYRMTLESDQITQDENYSYRYLLKVNPSIFRLRGVHLFEGDKKLSPVSPAVLLEDGRGVFFIAVSSEGDYYLYFTPSDDTDPRSNGKAYTLHLPVFFLSQTMGAIYLSILGILLAWFIVFIIQSKRLQVALASPYGFLSSLDAFVTQRFQVYFYPITNRRALEEDRNGVWRHLLWWTVLAAFTYIGMEWLFFVTKPSFMDIFGLYEKLLVLLNAAMLIAVPALMLVLLLWVLDVLLVRIKWSGLPLLIATLIPTMLFAFAALLMVDNFTYTVFRFGIVSTSGILRFLYALGFLLGLIKIHRHLLLNLGLRGVAAKSPPPPRYATYVISGLFTISLVLMLVKLDLTSFAGEASAQTTPTQARSLPNIILLGSDGLNAVNMSVYGYERDTTPNMRRLAETSLLAENAFSNAGQSTGSVISIFASKLPTQTRVLYPPDILQLKDSFEHLPGILKHIGYVTIELGARHFVDAYTVNLRNGFDLVNDRSLEDDGWYQSMQGRGYDDAFYFLYLLEERITGRLNHIFFIEVMENPMALVAERPPNFVDKERLDKLLDLISNSEKPFFVHVHMMGTHGEKFNPRAEKFSLGKTQDEKWMADFYDDSILDFDEDVSRVLDALEESGTMDNTILILYSDHAMRWKVNMRIPLMIHFPNNQFAGRIQSNVQNLDIAPTILDYLDLPIPEWIEGQSLLDGEPAPDRLIFATGTKSTLLDYGKLDASKLKPPFYQFAWFNIVQCDRWYKYDALTAAWESGEVLGHTASCDPDSLLSMEAVQTKLVELLSQNGFDVSALIVK